MLHFGREVGLLVHYHKDLCCEGYCWVEIANRSATKKHAARFLKEYRKADKLICFSDNLNDYCMFEEADLK